MTKTASQEKYVLKKSLRIMRAKEATYVAALLDSDDENTKPRKKQYVYTSFSCITSLYNCMGTVT